MCVDASNCCGQCPECKGPDSEEPTAKTCPECKGEGRLCQTEGTRYTVKSCNWCKGRGRVPVSQTMPAVKP